MAQQLFNANVPIENDDNYHDGKLNGPVTINLTNYGTIEFDLTLYCLVFEDTEDGQLNINLKCNNELTEDLESVLRRLKGTVDVTHGLIDDYAYIMNAYAKPLVYMGNGEFIAAPISQTDYTDDGYDEYKINLCLELEPLPSAPLPTSPTSPIINGLLSGLHIGRALYRQIEVAPADYTTEPGARFVLKSNDGGLFYVHSKIIDEFSPVLKAWIQENRAGLCDGVPLSMRCSTAALSALMVLLYKQELSDSFGSVVHELLVVCDYWQMQSVLDISAQYIKDKLNTDQADFEVLFGWFVSVSMHLVDADLEWILLSRLFLLAADDQEMKARIETQMVEYYKAKSPEQSAALSLKMGIKNMK